VLVYPDVHSRIEIDPSFAPDAEMLSRFAGLYANYKEGNIIEGFYIAAKENTLYVYPAEDYGPLIERDEKRGVECTALSPTRYNAASGLYDFAVAPDGLVAYVTKDLASHYWRVNDA
jgi:hypothetical protein